MMNQTSVRLLEVTALLAGLTLFGCGRSPETKSAAFLETGKKLLKENDAPRAILQFRNAVLATPKNPDAYYQLSLAYFAVNDVKMSVATLRKALELNPRHTAARLRMAQVMTMASDPAYVKEARDTLKKILEESPDDVEALHSLGFADLKLGEPEDAVKHLTRALALAPQDVTLSISVAMAQAKLQQRDAAGAEEILRKTMQSNPKSSEAAIVLGRFYESQARWAEGEEQFHRAVSLDPNSGWALYSLATLQNRGGRKQEAEETFRRLSALPGKEFRATHAIFLFQEGRRDEAIRELENLAKQDPDDRGVRTRLIAAYRSTNRSGDAENVLATALKRNPKDAEALLQRAELLLLAKKYVQAEADIAQVLRFQPDSAEAHYVNAKVRQARNESLLYREELMKALQLDPKLLPIRLEAVQNMLSTNDGKAALALINETPEAEKKLPQTIVQRNWVLWSVGDLAEMRKGIDMGLALGPHADFLLQDGVWKLRAGQFAAARTSLEKALNINPTDIRALGALSESYKVQKQNAVALQKMKEYASKQPKSAAVQEFLGVMLMAAGDPREARAAFTQAQQADPGFARAELSLVQTDVLDGKYDDAKQRLEKILTSPDSKELAHLWLGNIEVIKGNRKAAIDHYHEVVIADPNNPQALNNYAYLLAEFANNPTDALKYAQKAKELVPTDSNYSDTLGWILYRKGLYPMAVSELERAAVNTKDPISKYHLAMAYAKVGDVERGRKALKVALQLNPYLPEAKMAREALGVSR